MIDEAQKTILADPQTSGGLLIAVDRKCQGKIEDILKARNLINYKIGQMAARSSYCIDLIA